MKRRKFIANSILAAACTGLTYPSITKGENKNENKFGNLSFGICSDLHQDLYPDVKQRLSAFIDDMKAKKPHFIIQLGDFCRPEQPNRSFMEIWNTFPNKKLHVIGNHDPEKKYTKDEVVKFWGALGTYYSLDINGYHLVILDGNETNPTPARDCAISYDRYISAEQIDWIEKDINSTDRPTIVFIHQSLDMDGGIENAAEVRAVLDRCNGKAGFQKVQLVFSGHHHLDYHNVINGIHYIQINSMSYHWQGDMYAESPFSEDLNKKYPHLKRMSHYKDPLWAYIEISDNGTMKMTGKKSSFFGKSPYEMGMPTYHQVHPVVPYISDRLIQLSR